LNRNVFLKAVTESHLGSGNHTDQATNAQFPSPCKFHI